MFLVRRICKVERKDSWQVAKLLETICGAYEKETGRSKATIYIAGAGTPAQEIAVFADWEQETIEANRAPNVPSTVHEANVELFSLVKSYEIEFFEIATSEKILERTS
ncbi:MAG: hypothetical protein CL887_00505 [Dehalococcoidia bacterium]|nr:hypothetical protein [Dehalococcoidia bacterium]|tara:strand:- start:721 stop:1044 length:324 start_codon:yes stop_codon:yes gene_type:complete